MAAQNTRNVRFWHLADNRGTATICPLLDQSGQRWILARDGLTADDPKRTLRSLFDHLIGRGEQCDTEPEPKRLRSLKIVGPDLSTCIHRSVDSAFELAVDPQRAVIGKG